MGSQPDHSTGRSAGLRHTLPPSDCHCRHRLASPRLHRIRPAIIRGQLCYVIAGVAFTSFAKAAMAWAAADAHCPDIAELVVDGAVPASLEPRIASGWQGAAS